LSKQIKTALRVNNFRTGSCIYPPLSLSCSKLQRLETTLMEKHLNTIVTANSKEKGKQPLSIRFLNLTNPNDATKSDALTAIRSHVARNTHGRKQESRRTRLEIRQYKPATRGNKTNNVEPLGKMGTEMSQATSELNLPVVRQKENQQKVIHLIGWKYRYRAHKRV
jgi:hypothetical protein